MATTERHYTSYLAETGLLMGLMRKDLLTSFLAVVTFLIVILYVVFLTSTTPPNVAGRRRFEPIFWTRLRSFRDTKSMVDEGYKKVRTMPGGADPTRVIKLTQSQYSNQASFQIHQSDKDLVVLSNNYIDELRSLPKNICSLSQAISDVWKAFTYEFSLERSALINMSRLVS
ncbi:MAG: hypothetical protein Q9212_007532, partial [Teloschistes hypoglaucus]